MSIEIIRPAEQTVPLVFASPHSGQHYPNEFIASSRLDPLSLRRSEDAFMDEVFGSAVEHGAPLLRARFARAYIDLNREAYELDPAMFNDDLPDYVNTTSARAAAGLGTIARIVSYGEEIYSEKLTFSEAKKRIDTCYKPYHDALRGLVEATRKKFGVCLLVDCHSMPSICSSSRLGKGQNDMVLGDCYGTACAPQVIENADRILSDMGLKVTRNDPYAGGFTTRHYSAPEDGIHVLQVEVNRALYMDEDRVARGERLPHLVQQISQFIRQLVELDPKLLLANV
ncbi:MAG: N-formylglutamate amidohydrolase [Rhodospirillales bacterium]|jgi:N-formylglutamate amidohydrolase